MKDKIVLVTGATAGIGKETALGVAKTGATVVLVGRNKEKGAQVVAEIKEKTGSDKLDFLTADLFSIKEIRRLAEEFKSKYSRLDVLINNAGAVFDKRETTIDGLEKTFALNHLSYFLLTDLLLDTIKQSAPARVVSVSSIAHEYGKIDFDNLQSEKSFGALSTYSTSKLLNVLFTYELARRLAGTGVTANCLHPGGVASNFADNTGGVVKIVAWLFKKTLAISEAKGAETSIYLATDSEVENVTGKYFDNKREKPSSRISYDETAQKKLWEQSEKIIAEH